MINDLEDPRVGSVMKCRGCGHRDHGHNRCRARRCRCWPPIVVSQVRPADAYEGTLSEAGSFRLDLVDAGYSGGYYEVRDASGEKTSWGSFQTFLGGLGLFRWTKRGWVARVR